METNCARLDIPGYRLLEQLGEGGMGAVYRAVQEQPPREVAIKVLSPGQCVRAFERESQVMGRLTHPHVVAIHAFGETADRHYLVMEYVPGTNLRCLMHPGHPWPVARVVDLITAIGQALSHIHAQGILHLDLKPENVLCGPRGELKVTDFGLAQPRPEVAAFAALESAQGTVDYCAPEQRYGLTVDPRTDLFALATIAYELLTGHLPGRVYVSASRFNRAVSWTLDDVLQRALARDREERQASVEQFTRAVSAAWAAEEATWAP